MSRGATRRLALLWPITLLALISSRFIVQAASEENFEIEGGSFEYDGDLGNNLYDQNSGGGFNGGGFGNNGPVLDYDPNGPFGGGGSFDSAGSQLDDFQMMPLAAGNSLSGRRGNRLANGSSDGFANGNSDGFLNANRNFDRACDGGFCGDGRGDGRDAGGYRFITELTWRPDPPFTTATSTSTQTGRPWWPTTTDYNGTTFVFSTSTHYDHGKWNCYTTEYRNRDPYNSDSDWREYDDGYYVFPDYREQRRDMSEEDDFYPYSPPAPTNIMQDQKVNINISNGPPTRRIITEEIYRGSNGIITTMIDSAPAPDFLGQGASANQQLSSGNQPLVNTFPMLPNAPPTRPTVQSAPSATQPVVVTRMGSPAPVQFIPGGQGASAPAVLNFPAAGIPSSFGFTPSAPPQRPIISSTAPPQRPVISSVSPFVAPIVGGLTSGVTNAIVGGNPFNNSPIGGVAPQRFASNPPAAGGGGNFVPPAQAPARAPVLLPSTPAATASTTRTATARPTRTLDFSSSEIFDSDYISLSDAGLSIRASLKTILVGAGVGILFLAVF